MLQAQHHNQPSFAKVIANWTQKAFVLALLFGVVIGQTHLGATAEYTRAESTSGSAQSGDPHTDGNKMH